MRLYRVPLVPGAEIKYYNVSYSNNNNINTQHTLQFGIVSFSCLAVRVSLSPAGEVERYLISDRSFDTFYPEILAGLKSLANLTIETLSGI